MTVASWIGLTVSAQRDVSPNLSEMLGRLSPADHYAFRDAFDTELGRYPGADGGLSVPWKTFVASADA